MNCRQCNSILKSSDEFLKCFECAGEYHLRCLSHIQRQDYEYIVSSKTSWKCMKCEKKKSDRSDDTPLTPTIQKAKPAFIVRSDSDSTSSTTGQSKKLICKSCSKGFAHNSFKAICIECESVFHIKCVPEFNSKDDFYKVKSVWKCISCRPNLATLSALPSLSTDKVCAVDKPPADVAGAVSLADLLSEMRSFRHEVINTNKEFKESLDKHSDWVADNGKKIEEISMQINNLASDIDLIRQENCNLKKVVSELSHRVDFLEQSTRDNMIEIQGVPFTQGENVIEIIGKIANVIGFKFDNNMIDKCYRIRPTTGAPDRPGTIVVRFVRHIDMEKFIQKRREKRNLNTRDIGFMSGNAGVVYVNSSLTPAKRKLLRDARQVKNEKHYTFIWVVGGRIFLRKNQGGPAIEIKSMEDLNKLE